MKQSKNKKLIILLTIITGLFLIVALYLVYFQLFKAQDLNTNPKNARNFADESLVKRGDIYDRDGNVLATSVKTEDGYERRYTYSYMYSNIIGYSDKNLGKSAIEAYHNSDLLNIADNKDIFTQIDSIVDDSESADLYLTIDDEIQSRLYEILGDNYGSIILAKPDTGEIVSMITKPSFNIQYLRENWDQYIESDNALLLNRATQGLYEPGSIFKIVTSMVFLDNNIDLTYNDTGSATIADYTVSNYNDRQYGQIGLEEALNYSSNAYFFDKSQLVTNKMFTDTLYDFGIGRSYNFPINRSESIFPFKSSLSALEKGNAAYGQGETLVKPLDMLLVAFGIANDGIVNQPYIVDKIDRNGIVQSTRNQVLSNDIDAQNARLLRSYLKSTADYNGFTLNNGIDLAGKTGTAETDNANRAWYLGMAPAENPEYVIIVNIEDTNQLAGAVAAPIAIEALNFVFSR